jgi:hypothetical protein
MFTVECVAYIDLTLEGKNMERHPAMLEFELVKL